MATRSNLPPRWETRVVGSEASREGPSPPDLVNEFGMYFFECGSHTLSHSTPNGSMLTVPAPDFFVQVSVFTSSARISVMNLRSPSFS